MIDLTVAAVPMYFGTMAAEHRYLKQEHGDDYGAEAADYTRDDTITSLAMGVGSLVAPFVMPTLLKPFVPGKGKWGKHLLVGLGMGALVTTVADRLADTDTDTGIDADPEQEPSRLRRIARKVRKVTGPATVAAGTVAVATTFQRLTTPKAQWEAKGKDRDKGTGPLAWAASLAGWDFIYYWNHRFMHEVRGLWAIHVVHHSSERYNLSTALRQPVADAFGVWVPYGLMARFGIRPYLIAQARAINLIYQYWIHTEVIRSIGPGEAVLNTPSHHRVHHGSQSQYLDRNHGSILIVWDKLFGTFEPEDEQVVYGLTKNIKTYNLAKVAGHEYGDIVRDVANSTNWKDRLSFVLRGPGWAYERHREMAEQTASDDQADVLPPATV